MDYEGHINQDINPMECQKETISLDEQKITVEHRKRSTDYKLHRHNFFELEFYVSGSGVNEINGIPHKFKNGSVFLYNETDFHKLHVDPGTEVEIYYASFNWNMVSKKSFIYDNISFITPISIDISENELEYQRLVDTFHHMLWEYEQNFQYKNDYLSNALENILITLFRLQLNKENGSKSNNTIAKQALFIIQRNFRKDIGLNSIAAQLHTSPNYLSSAFHKSYHKTIVSYINDMRLNYAANALRVDNYISITNVCFECGYKTYSHFMKDFSKKFGTSPKKYQQTHN